MGWARSFTWVGEIESQKLNWLAASRGSAVRGERTLTAQHGEVMQEHKAWATRHGRDVHEGGNAGKKLGHQHQNPPIEGWHHVSEKGQAWRSQYLYHTLWPIPQHVGVIPHFLTQSKRLLLQQAVPCCALQTQPRCCHTFTYNPTERILVRTHRVMLRTQPPQPPRPSLNHHQTIARLCPLPCPKLHYPKQLSQTESSKSTALRGHPKP